MPAVNQFNGFGGTPGFNNWPTIPQPYAAGQLGWRALPLLGGYQ